MILRSSPIHPSKGVLDGHPILLPRGPTALPAGPSSSQGHDDLPLLVRPRELDAHRCQSQTRTSTTTSPRAENPTGTVWVKGPSREACPGRRGKALIQATSPGLSNSLQAQALELCQLLLCQFSGVFASTDP